MVLALFKDKAILQVDGQRRVLQVGEQSPEGVKLIAASSEEALLEVAGRRASYPLGSHISSAEHARPAQIEVNLWVDSLGMFKTTGSINGQTVGFLVDTGATTIAMNAHDAKRLGIDFLYLGTPVAVHTASATEVGYQINLKSVRVGEIELRDVAALVLNGEYPNEVLLGMSFLGRLQMERNGRSMVLRKKF